MKYIKQNIDNVIFINLNERSSDNIYVIRLTSLATNYSHIFELNDISNYKNAFQKFNINIGNVLEGQYVVNLYLNDNKEKSIFSDVWNVLKNEITINKQYQISDNNKIVYQPTSLENDIPQAPILNDLLYDDNSVIISFSGNTLSKYYDIYRKVNDDEYEYLNTVYVQSFNDYNIIENTTYTYKIKAKNAEGYSDFSNEKIITI